MEYSRLAKINKVSKWLSLFILSQIVTVMPVTAAVTFNLAAGYLRQNAATPLAASTSSAPSSGALLLLVAAGGGNGTTFTSTVPAGQYVAGGDKVLAMDSFNTNAGASGTGGITSNTLTFDNTGLANVYVELRWYPGITLAQYQAGATPTVGMVLGEYNPIATSLNGNTTSLNPDGGAAWSVPAASSTYSLFFQTAGAGGHEPDTAGFANFSVGAAAVPEPSTYVGVSLMMLAGGWLIRRKRLQAA